MAASLATGRSSAPRWQRQSGDTEVGLTSALTSAAKKKASEAAAKPWLVAGGIGVVLSVITAIVVSNVGSGDPLNNATTACCCVFSVAAILGLIGIIRGWASGPK